MVLHIEDDADDVEIVARLLRKQALLDAHLVHAASLDAAEPLLHLGPDVILLDLGLPDAAGELEALDRLLKAAPGIPIVVLTGHAAPALGRHAVAMGAQDHLSKQGLTGHELARALLHARERARLQRTLTERTTRLERYSRAIAHDLRGPLVGLVGLCRLARRKEDPRLLDQVEASAHGLLRTVEGLFDDVQDEARPEPVDVEDLIAEVIGSLRWPSRFRFSMDVDVPLVEVHRTALLRVVQNLLHNALRHHDRDEGRIEVTATHARGMMLLQVADDGPGIPIDMRNRVFDEGHTTGGTGLGLATVREVAARHEATVRPEARRPRGTVFKIAWPAPISYVGMRRVSAESQGIRRFNRAT